MAGRRTVLHAIPTLVGGGAEKQLALLACAQQAMGYNVHVACVGGGVNESPLYEGGVRVHKLRSLGNHDPVLLWRLSRLMREVCPAVVQTWLPQMDVLAGSMAQRLGIVHVLSERASAAAYPPGWKLRMRAHVGARADAVVANSQAGLDYWRGVGIRGTGHLIRNGACMASIVAAAPACPADLGFAPTAQIVLFAGRLVAQKNLPLLLDAVDRVLAERPRAVCLLFGEGPMAQSLRLRIAEMRDGSRVRLSGYTGSLAAWMKAAAVVVSTSRFEGAPNVVIEAMLTGCPLVVSDIPEHRELLDSREALLVPEPTAQAYAASILDVLRNPAAALQRAELAKVRASRWTVDAAAHAYLQLYEELAETA